MAVMVWCNKCSTVVWAYDHLPYMDLRGVINMMGLPCPNCHRAHCFDGWSSNNIDGIIDQYPKEVFDAWSAMRFIAKLEHKEWKPSPDNRWLIGAYEGLRLSVKRWREEKELTTDILLAAKLDGKIEAYKWLLGEPEKEDK